MSIFITHDYNPRSLKDTVLLEISTLNESLVNLFVLLHDLKHAEIDVSYVDSISKYRIIIVSEKHTYDLVLNYLKWLNTYFCKGGIDIHVH